MTHSPTHKAVTHIIKIKSGVLFCVYIGDMTFSLPDEGSFNQPFLTSLCVPLPTNSSEISSPEQLMHKHKSLGVFLDTLQPYPKKSNN